MVPGHSAAFRINTFYFVPSDCTSKGDEGQSFELRRVQAKGKLYLVARFILSTNILISCEKETRKLLITPPRVTISRDILTLLGVFYATYRCTDKQS